MPTRLIARSLITLALVAPCAAHAAMLGTRDGEWKDTFTGNDAEGKAKVVTQQECRTASVTVQKMIDKLEQGGCKVKILHQTASMVEIEQTCATPDEKGGIHFHIRMEALSPTRIVSTMEQTDPSGHIDHLKSDARWLGATCEKH